MVKHVVCMIIILHSVSMYYEHFGIDFHKQECVVSSKFSFTIPFWEDRDSEAILDCTIILIL